MRREEKPGWKPYRQDCEYVRDAWDVELVEFYGLRFEINGDANWWDVEPCAKYAALHKRIMKQVKKTYDLVSENGGTCTSALKVLLTALKKIGIRVYYDEKSNLSVA